MKSLKPVTKKILISEKLLTECLETVSQWKFTWRHNQMLKAKFELHRNKCSKVNKETEGFVCS